MIDGWLLHLIFSHLSPRDLISCAAVCREFYAIARADKAWERHKQRVLKFCPTLQPIFDQHGQETDGKRVLKKRKKQTPQGTWYIFARFLMRCPFQLAFERRKSKFAVVITSTVLEAAILFFYYPIEYKKSAVFNVGTHSIINNGFEYFFSFKMETANNDYVICSCAADSVSARIYKNNEGFTYLYWERIAKISAPFLNLVHNKNK